LALDVRCSGRPAIALCIALPFVPESPRWLIKENREPEALQILARIGGRAHALAEAEDIHRAIQKEAGSIRELLKPGLRLPLIIAVCLAVLQQISGVNTVLYYGALIFREQVGEHNAAGAIGVNVIIGVVNAVSTFVAVAVIDKTGRKPTAAHLVRGDDRFVDLDGLCIADDVSACYIDIDCHSLLCIQFRYRDGSGGWVLMSELFPTRLRGRAMAVGTVSFMACLTSTFLTLVVEIGAGGAFWLYAVISLISFLFIWRIVPETKGRTLEDIERLWKGTQSP
jgi:MFS family permease